MPIREENGHYNQCITQDRQGKNPNPENRSVLEPPADELSQIKAGSYVDCIKGIFAEQPVRIASTVSSQPRRAPLQERDKSKGRQKC